MSYNLVSWNTIAGCPEICYRTLPCRRLEQDKFTPSCILQITLSHNLSNNRGEIQSPLFSKHLYHVVPSCHPVNATNALKGI